MKHNVELENRQVSKPKQATELLYLGPAEDFFSNVVAGFHNPVTIQLQSYNWTLKQQENGVHTHSHTHT